jgi:hypothetical protein
MKFVTKFTILIRAIIKRISIPKIYLFHIKKNVKKIEPCTVAQVIPSTQEAEIKKIEF